MADKPSGVLSEEKLRAMREHTRQLALMLDDYPYFEEVRQHLSPLVGWLRDLAKATGHNIEEGPK